MYGWQTRTGAPILEPIPQSRSTCSAQRPIATRIRSYGDASHRRVWARQRQRLTLRLIQSEARHAPLTLNQPSEPHELATRVRQRVQRLIAALHVPEGGPGVIASRKLDQSQAPTSCGGRRNTRAPEPVRSGNGHRNDGAAVALKHRGTRVFDGVERPVTTGLIIRCKRPFR